MKHLEQHITLFFSFLDKGTMSFFGTTTGVTTPWGC